VKHNSQKVSSHFDRAAKDVDQARPMKIEFLWTRRGVQKHVKEAERLMRESQKNRPKDEKFIFTLRSRLIQKDQD
jgi:hypothetical protein